MLASAAVVLNTKSFNWFYLFSFFLLDKYYILFLYQAWKVKYDIFFKEDVVVVIIWCLDLQLLMQSVAIPINASSNPAHGEMYSIQHYEIMFVSDLRQVSDFLRELWFPPPIKLTADITEILLKVVLNTITPNLFFSAR